MRESSKASLKEILFACRALPQGAQRLAGSRVALSLETYINITQQTLTLANWQSPPEPVTPAPRYAHAVRVNTSEAEGRIEA